MLGTIANTAGVIAGSLLGLLFRKGIPQKVTDTVMKGLGMCTIYIGITSALKGEKMLLAVVSIALGALLGTLLDLDGRLNRLGEQIQTRMKNTEGSDVVAGFVSASLLFSVGAMSIVGSLQSGLTGDHSMLFTKTVMDFISSMVIAASLGIGVLFSAVVVFVFQGSITLLAQVLAPILSDGVITEMTGVGGILLIGLGLNLVGATKLKIMNYVPAIFIAVGLYYVM